jgi:hypothetical protein
MILLVVLGMIVPSGDDAITPVRLVLSPPARAEEPVTQDAMFVIDIEPPADAQPEPDPMPIESPPLEPLDVDAAALEPHASASPRDSWVEEIASDALVAELVPKLPAPPRRPQALAARAEPGVPQPVVEGAGARGGIGGELGRRLQAAGAQTGDVQVSMRWDGVNDIDLHVTVEPFGGGGRSVISWQQKFGACGGVLDVDANAHPVQLTPAPVENVFWARGRAPFGRYTIAIHHYMPWSRLPRTPVEVAVLVDGKVTRFQVVATSGEPARVVTSFIRHPAGVADQLAAANPND